MDFMTVNLEATGFVAGLFREQGFVNPAPRNFGARVRSFNLNIPSERVARRAPAHDFLKPAVHGRRLS